MVIKNLWSLQIDEAIVAEEIKDWVNYNEKPPRYEIFFPTNSQLKDIDLILYDLKKGTSKSIQIKGSRSFNWKEGKGRSWHQVTHNSIFNPRNKVDFFIFVWHVLYHKGRKRHIRHAFLVIPTSDFKKILKKKKVRNTGEYHFGFWTDFKETVIESRNNPVKEIDFSEFYNGFDLLKK